MEKSSTLDRRSSIEKEPRTINIDAVREEAIYVVNTRSVEEALNIFTKGLQPVTCCGREEATVTDDITNMDDDEQVVLDSRLPLSPRMFDFRKIASAPF